MVGNSCCFLGHQPKWLRVCRMRLIYEDGDTLTSSKYLSVYSYILIHGENHIWHDNCELQDSLTYDSFGPLGYPMWGLGTCLVKHFSWCESLGLWFNELLRDPLDVSGSPKWCVWRSLKVSTYLPWWDVLFHMFFATVDDDAFPKPPPFYCRQVTSRGAHKKGVGCIIS